MEMGDAARIQPRVKVPRRTIYFASGETMEEYSTDEEEEEEECTKKDVSTVDTVRARLLTFYSMTRVICLISMNGTCLNWAFLHSFFKFLPYFCFQLS